VVDAVVMAMAAAVTKMMMAVSLEEEEP